MIYGQALWVRRTTLRRVLAIDLAAGDGAPLPSEFRLFRAGVNATTKGDFVFDEAAAAAVMAEFQRGGVDLAIDLAHDSLDPIARAQRSDADDARGWFGLEVRGGELWAVGVTWTPDGARRLSERTQRYISPAFIADQETGRIVAVVNCALCSMPATLDAVPLVASREVRAVTLEDRPMDPKVIRDALDALEAGDEAKALEILKALIASAAGAEPAPEADAPADPLAEGATATSSPAQASRSPEVDAEIIRLSTEVATLTAERDARELDERRELIARLVGVRAETPATAWTGDPAKRTPCERLAREPLVTLRARVVALEANAPSGGARRPPASAAGESLTESEQRAAERITDPARRERFISLRMARKGTIDHG